MYRHIIKDYNSRGDLSSANGVEMPKDLKNAILYESTFEDCTWGTTDWTDLSGNGCSFSLCDFYSNQIHNAALQHALFESAVLYNCDMRSSNFAYSLFTWSVMDHCTIDGCSFAGAVFNHVQFHDCNIAHSNFELCRFQSSTFQNIDFRNLALKYTFLHDIHMENVALPFMQMPYTFGGLKYVFSTKDDIKIASMSNNTPVMSVEEYRKALPHLTVFFSGHNDYFPLANCYLALGQREFAEQANETGIIGSATAHNFRKLYFFCVQAAQELEITREKRSSLYQTVCQMVMSNKFSQAEYYEFRHYFPLIKQLMFDNPHDRPMLSLSLHTNIAADDFHNLGLLMRTLDEVAEQCGAKLDSKHIEIRHNSPNVLGWFPVGNIDQLLNLLQSTWAVIYPVLSESLQTAANATALITGGINIYATVRKKKANTTKKIHDPNLKEKVQSPKFSKMSKHDISPDEIAVLRLRTELLKRQQLWQKAECRDSGWRVFDTNTVRNKLLERSEELKKSGIRIESVEIQLLDDRCDALELLYNGEEKFE